jgi:DNA-binding PadR family transcriptional regulator
MLEAALLVLSSLAQGDKHGYAMMVDIEAFSGTRLGAGTLYGAITRLEERGCIRPLDSDDRRRPYRLTAEGRRYLKEQLSALDRTAKVGLDRLRRA